MLYAIYQRMLQISEKRWLQRITRVTIGVGTMLVLGSVIASDHKSHTGMTWEILGLIGIAIIAVSLPSQTCVLYVRVASIKKRQTP